MLSRYFGGRVTSTGTVWSSGWRDTLTTTLNTTPERRTSTKREVPHRVTADTVLRRGKDLLGIAITYETITITATRRVIRLSSLIVQGYDYSVWPSPQRQGTSLLLKTCWDLALLCCVPNDPTKNFSHVLSYRRHA